MINIFAHLHETVDDLVPGLSLNSKNTGGRSKYPSIISDNFAGMTLKRLGKMHRRDLHCKEFEEDLLGGQNIEATNSIEAQC